MKQSQPVGKADNNLQEQNPLIDGRSKMADDDNVILKRNLSNVSKYCLMCSECNPSWEVYQTIGNRDPNYKKRYFNIKPSKNICCGEFETEISETNDQEFITSQRTKMGLFGCLPCCDGPSFNIILAKNQQLLGQCNVKNFVVGVSAAVQKDLIYPLIKNNTVWFGNINKCCQYESNSWEDIWDSERKLRLGRIMYIKRVRQAGCCCFLLDSLNVLGFCCGIPDYWIKLEFPERATPEERAMMIAAVANKSGQCCCCLQPTACCTPY